MKQVILDAKTEAAQRNLGYLKRTSNFVKEKKWRFFWGGAFVYFINWLKPWTYFNDWRRKCY